jgi:hypothetical protein
MILGTNEIQNCDAALVVEGMEVFRLRARSGDDQLVADFEVRDETEELVAKVAKNNIVYARPGLEVKHGSDFSEVANADTGELIARAEEISQGVVRIIGTFIVNGFAVEITEEFMKLGGVTLSGNKIMGSGNAISLQSGNMGIGAA